VREPPSSIDELIPRLRARASDPERRTDVRKSELTATLGTLDLGGLLSMGRSIGAGLRNVVAANQAGRVDPAGHALAQDIGRAMSTPAPSVLPAPATEATVADAERALGVGLPTSLRRVYTEVADGGFGPGEGILPLAMVVSAWRELSGPDGPLPRGRTWPAALVPVVERDPGYDCVEASTGRVVAWDPEALSERSTEDRFRRSFSEAAPSVEAWLGAWVESKTQAEQMQELMARSMGGAAQVRMAREARANIAKMSPEERAKMGLPEVGWERVVWGGLGLEDEEGGGPG